MAGINQSLKRLQINKANTRMVAMVAVAAFMVTFTVVASRALLSKRAYQGKVIGIKEKAVKQLESNIQATQNLETSYKAFVGTNDNVIGGNPQGAGDRDGDNAKITLDALPSKYDFPALATSLEKILTTNSYKVGSITGTDDEIAQQTTTVGVPAPIVMPFSITTQTNLEGAKNLLGLFERSIRPIQVQTFEASGSNGTLLLTVTAQTYYQPVKGLNIKNEVVK
jgi:hypothetical protein